MELSGSNVVKVTGQRKHALLGLVVPHLHFEIVTSTDKHVLGLVKIDSSDRTYGIN